ncbi:MFS transporter [Cohnella xylanilytica]|uniref:MFS transporter n=1 Tax=Cohnella xylanilytica TaxID=557555 RepID=UPI001B0F128E|nr:MFS transporter [Cohnella xylanilytica]GIO15757.1 MFS transporter [Cohnella xylanilytica]
MRQHRPLLLGLAMFLASLNLRPAINAVSPIVQTLRSDLGMSASAASLLTAIPVLCMGIFSPLAVRWGHRHGIERVIAWSLAVIGAGNALRLVAHSAFFLMLTAFIAGVGIGAIGPLLSGFIKERFPARISSMISLYTIALAVGATSSSWLSVPLQTGMRSWRGSLAIWAILAFVALAGWTRIVLRDRADSTALVSSGASCASRRSKLPWGSGRAWLLTLSFGALGMLFYSLTAWLPPIVENMGYGREYAGNMLTLFSLMQIPVGLLFPLLLKRVPSRLFWLLLGSGFLLAGFALLELSAPPWIAVALIGVGPGVLFPLNLMLPIEEADDAGQAAAWSAMTQSAGYVIGALGPVLLGWLHDAAGGSDAWLIAGWIAIAAIMVAIQLAISLRARGDRRSRVPAVR